MLLKTKQEFEEEIQIAAVDAVGCRETPEYKTAVYRLEKLLCKYTAAFVYPERYPNDPLRESTYSRYPWGLALTETAIECLKSYNTEKGPFLHYYLPSFSRKFHRERAKDKLEERRKGIRLPGKVETQIREIKKYCVSRGLDPEDPEAVKKLAAVMSLQEETVKELIRVDRNASPVSDIVRTEDGEEISLFDFVVDTRERTDERIMQETDVEETLDSVEVKFNEMQARQKELLSMLVTAAVIQSFEGDLERSRRILKKYSFCSERIFTITKEQDGEIPRNKEIAKLCGRSEQSASRTWHNFVEQVSIRTDAVGDPISCESKYELEKLN